MSMRYVEIQARSVEEAVRLALEQLDLSRDDVDVQLLAGAETGDDDDEVLVRVTPHSNDMPERGNERVRPTRPESRQRPELRPETRSRPEGRPEPRPEGRGEARPEVRSEARPRRDDRDRGPRLPSREPEEGNIVVDVPAVPSGDDEQSFSSPADAVAPIAAEVLQRLLLGMRFRGRIERHDPAEEAKLTFEGEDPAVVLNVTGVSEQDKSLLIGRRGEALQALQFMVNLMLGAKTDLWARVVVDVDGYRIKRNEALTNLAERMAERVMSQRQPFSLEPMSPYDRRIVHMALSDHPEVRTESTGEGDERRVVIMLRPS